MKRQGAVTNLIQAVSQQPPDQRFEGQLGEQINCISSTLTGLGSRPGSIIFPTASLSEQVDAAIYEYERGDGSEAYRIELYNRGVTVINLTTGNTATITFSDYSGTAAYMATGPLPDKDVFSFHTIGDTTYIASNLITPAMVTTGATAAKHNEYLIYLKTASWGCDYTIQAKISGTQQIVGAYSTPSTVTLNVSSTTQEANKAVTLKTHTVMADLYADLKSNLLEPTVHLGITGEYFGDVIHVVAPAWMDLNLFATDTNHGNDIRVVHTEVTEYADLPKEAFNGYKVEVTGTDKTKFNNYFLQYVTDSGAAYGVGRWKEVAGWGLNVAFDPKTMPMKLVRTGAHAFTLSFCTWDSRAAGDDDTNPLPSFIGHPIQDIFSYGNRLCFLANESLCGSVTDELYNFWADTVVESSDSDPIDITVNDNQVVDLKYAVIFNGNLVLFSSKAQFFHSSDVPFTQKTISMLPKTRFASALKVRPVVAGNSMFYIQESGGAFHLHELTQEALSGTTTGYPVTEHAKQYMQGSCRGMAVALNERFLFMLSDADLKTIYVYQWYKIGSESKQQALHKWVFTDDVYNVSVVNNVLLMGMHKSSGYSWLAYIILSDTDTPGLHFGLRLDNQAELTVSDEIQGTPGVYGITLPAYYTDMAPDDHPVIITDDLSQVGKIAQPAFIASGKLYVMRPEGSTGVPTFILGTRFHKEAEFTPPILRDQFERPILGSKLKVSTLQLPFKDTGSVSLTVEYYSYETLVSSFTTSDVGLESTIINDALADLNGPYPVIDMLYSLPVYYDADRVKIKIVSDSHMPFHIASYGWTGQASLNGRISR